MDAHVSWRRRLSLAAALLALLPAAARAADAAAPLAPATCSVPGLIDQARAGLRKGSPAYKNLLRHLFKEAAIALPPHELLAAVQREQDPELLELLGAGLATRASRDENPALLQSLLSRAAQDPNPALRAASVRALQGSASVESMEKTGNVVTYQQLVRDPSPEVRQAVADNLLAEDRDVYHGHDRGLTDAAVAAAGAASDPDVQARLLSGVSMERASPGAVAQVQRELGSDSPQVRAAAARALGGVPAEATADARSTLLARLRQDPDPAVRRAALDGLVRLGPQAARALFPQLRAADPSLGPDLDAWGGALALNLQEWHLLLREKERRLGR